MRQIRQISQNIGKLWSPVFLAWVGHVTGNGNIFLVGLISSVTNIPRIINLSLNSGTMGPQ